MAEEVKKTVKVPAAKAPAAATAAPAPEAAKAAPAGQAQPNAAGNPAEQAKQEAVAKAQEMGKKLTGFLGGLAEKAKGLDVKELTEKAKQKVNEVKDKAAELNTGKAENQIPPRETMTADQVKQLFDAAAKAEDELPEIAAAVLNDVAQGEQIASKLKFGTASDPVYIAVSAKNVFLFTKSADQYLLSIYPVAKICGFSVLPPRGDALGRFTIMLEKEDVKLTLASMEAYANAALLYKKLKEAVGK